MSEQSAKERLWKVRVVRYTRSGDGPRDKPKRERLNFIIAAQDSDEAMARGRAHGETTAPFGMVLEEVIAMEAASITLPYQL